MDMPDSKPDKPDRHPDRKRSFAVATVVLVLFVCFLAVEIYLRIDNARVIREFEAHMRDELTVRKSDNASLIYEYIPGKPKINSHGFMDLERSLEKPEGVHRIVVIGDSLVNGTGIDLDQTFPRVLEQLLQGDGQKVEVLSFAVTGYSTSQQMALLERALAFSPDEVILAYCMNDPASPIYHNANDQLGRYFYRPTSYAWFRLCKKLHGMRERRLASDDDYHRTLHSVYRIEIGIDLAEFSRVATRAGLSPKLLIVPVLVGSPGDSVDAERYHLRDVNKDLSAIANAVGYTVIDAVDDLQDMPWERARVRDNDPWHLSAAAHSRIAEGLAARRASGSGAKGTE
jgi:lysophospholipase L1-like esterase